MSIFLYIAAVYLGYTLFVFIRNIFEFRSLQNEPVFTVKEGELPLVSICIPARNEERVIDRCVTSALKQNYPNFEVLVLDDHSTDKTPDILSELSGIINNLHHLKGKPKPDGWLGKPWACHQLSKHASGEYLIFMDADVWLEEDAIQKALSALQKSSVITVWPKQQVCTFWEKMVIPIIYFGLYTLLPARYVEKDPKWLPEKWRKKVAPHFAAACGQFLAFQKQAYHQIDGHKSVKNEIVEDVELSKLIKKSGLTITMFDGVGTVNCRMYHSHTEIFQGLRKNFFVGFGRNTLLFVLMAALQGIVYIVPFVFLILGNESEQVFSAGLIALFWIQRWILDLKFGWNPFISLLQPLSILWFQVLAGRCLWDYFTGKKPLWKGREV